MNQGNSRVKTMLVVMAAYGLVYLLLWQFMPGLFGRGPAAQQPEQAQSLQQLWQQAQAKEAEARAYKGPVSEQRQVLRDAERLYQQLASRDPKGDLGINAQFQVARLYEKEKLAGDSESANLNQAVTIYKNLTHTFPKDRRAGITLDGQNVSVPVWQTANARLEDVLKRLDVEHSRNPLYKIIDVMVGLTGRIPGFSYWFAILLITVVVKTLLYPLQKKGFINMQKMAALAPKMKEIQERYKDRPGVEQQQEIQKLYREEGVNIAGGCLPMILQGVALIPLYQMFLHYEYQFRKGTFLWIGSPWSFEHPNILGTSLAAFDIPILVVYIISMFLQSKFMPMTAPPTDPQQAQQQKMMTYMMPAMFGVMMFFWKLPSAFTLYWLMLNVISVVQQAQIMKHVKTLPASAPATASGPSAPAVSSNGNGKIRDARSIKPGGRKGPKKSRR